MVIRAAKKYSVALTRVVCPDTRKTMAVSIRVVGDGRYSFCWSYTVGGAPRVL